jgi:hypothetical protein
LATLVSGLLGLVADTIILLGFPGLSLWGIGFDLISRGLAQRLYALQSVLGPAQRKAASLRTQTEREESRADSGSAHERLIGPGLDRE